jgi:hypothetical protein
VRVVVTTPLPALTLFAQEISCTTEEFSVPTPLLTVTKLLDMLAVGLVSDIVIGILL